MRLPEGEMVDAGYIEFSAKIEDHLTIPGKIAESWLPDEGCDRVWRVRQY